MQTPEPEISIRLLSDDDAPALARLAERDSSSVPFGTLLGAGVGGRLLVARSLATGEVIADPFAPTAELRALLADRARQMHGSNGGGGLLARFRSRRPRSARAALAGSPPGAGGRLLKI